MKRFFLSLLCFGALLIATPRDTFAAAAAAAEPAGTSSSTTAAPADAAAANNNAAAAVVVTHTAPRPPDFLEHIVDMILDAFNVSSTGNNATRYGIAFGILLVAFLLRRVVTSIVFAWLKKLAARTETTLDDKLFPALEAPAATFVTVTGIFAALKVLKLSPSGDEALGYGSTIAFSLVLFWGLLRAFNAVLDHVHEVARERGMGIAAFMPWIKKTLVAIFVIFGVLLVAQSLGADVKAFLAGLGIGGLAFALAAQDTIANVFGSIVVAIDQPFKVGEVVQIGANAGTVEDIGLRSTKIRKADKSLVIVPNKTVAAETITNLSRITQRRVEQTLMLTYSSPPDQVSALIEEIRALIQNEPGVDKGSVAVFFNAFSPSSIDIFLAYMTVDADINKMFDIRLRLSMKFVKAIEARKLSFAFPTQTLQFAGDFAQKIATRRDGESAQTADR